MPSATLPIIPFRHVFTSIMYYAGIQNFVHFVPYRHKGIRFGEVAEQNIWNLLLIFFFYKNKR